MRACQTQCAVPIRAHFQPRILAVLVAAGLLGCNHDEPATPSDIAMPAPLDAAAATGPDAEPPVDAASFVGVDLGPINGCDTHDNPCIPGPFDPRLVAATRSSAALVLATITRLGATTPGIPVDPLNQQAIARVDRVPWERARFFSMFVGQEITISMADDHQCLQPGCGVGYQGYFFASKRTVGPTLEAWQEDRVDVGTVPMLEQIVPAIDAGLAGKALFQRMAAAVAVVEGTVTATRSLNDPLLSEHDPNRGEADLMVDCAFRGGLMGTVKVLFAQSDDVAWFTSPKLKAGESAIFLLQDPRGVFNGASAPPPGDFAVVLRMDVQPRADAQRIHDLLSCPPLF